jgi:PAS domain S-box-containing protein
VAIPLKVLILEDQHSDAELMLHELRRAGFAPAWRLVNSKSEFLLNLAPDIDVVLADYHVPMFEAPHALELLQERELDIPFIVVSDTISEEAAVDCLKRGAADYLRKDRLARLGPAVARAIEEKRSRRHATAVTDALALIGEELLGTPDVEQVSRLIVDSVWRLFPTRAVSLHVLDERTQELRQLAGAGEPEALQEAPNVLYHVGEGVAGLAVAERQRMWTPDFLDDRRFRLPGELRVSAAELKYRAAAGIPLAVRDRVIGVLSVRDVTGRVFDEGNLRHMALFAHQATMLLEQARLYRDVEHRRHAAESLAAVQRGVIQSLGQREVAQRIVESVLSLLKVMAVRLFRLDPATGDLVAVAEAGDTVPDMRPDASSPFVLPAGSGVTGRSAAEGRPVASTDALVDPEVTYDPKVLPRIKEIPYRAVLGLPLTVHGRVIGALWASDRTGRVFDREDVRVGSAFADGAAVALENARLFEEAQSRRREAEQAEAAARESEARYRGLIEHSIQGIFIHQDFVIRLANRAFAHMLGYESPHELVGENLGRFLAPGEVERLRAFAAARLLGQPVPSRYQFEGRQRDGHSVWVEVLGSLISWDGQPAIMETLLDVSEHRRTEAELWHSQERYGAIVEGSIQGILVQADGMVRFVNSALLRLLGYEREEELLGKPSMSLVHPDDAERLEGYRQSRLRGDPAPTRYEFRALRKDGSIVAFDCALTPMQWEGTPATLATMMDMTAHRELEERFRQAQKMEAIGQLAGGIAHDFNNLLTVIIGRSQLLLRSIPPEDATYRNLTLIHDTAHRAAALTTQLLAFSRRQLLEPKVLMLNQIVHGLEGLLRRLIGEDIQLTTRLDPSPGRVKADPSQLEQVIMNLTVNARDAMPAGGPLTISTTNVELTETEALALPGICPGPHVMLAITDAGVGMDEATRLRIFEPFFTTKEEGKGTGLGLSTVWGIVHQSGGAIQVQSRVGEGTTFSVYLPRVHEEVKPEHSPTPAALAGGGETILLIEDDSELRTLAQEVLEGQGYRILAAGLPSEALDIAVAHPGPIHLLLTDVVMPGASGRQIADRLSATRPDMRVLYMSGYTDDTILPHGVLAQEFAFLAKPFTPDTLARKVREVLDG